MIQCSVSVCVSALFSFSLRSQVKSRFTSFVFWRARCFALSGAIRTRLAFGFCCAFSPGDALEAPPHTGVHLGVFFAEGKLLGEQGQDLVRHQVAGHLWRQTRSGGWLVVC